MSSYLTGIGQNLFRSGLSGVLALFFSNFANFILIPILINYLGDRNYGFWVLIGTLLGYFGALDLGLSRAITRFVSQCLGQKNYRNIRTWINAAFFSYLILAFLGFAISIIIWMVVKLNIDDPSEAFLLSNSCLIATLTFSLCLPSLCFQGILSAYLRQDILNLIQIIVTIIRSTGFIFAIYTDFGLLLIVSIAAFSLLINSFLVTYFARRVHGSLELNFKTIRKNEYFIFIRYAIVSFLAQLADLFRFKTIPFLIAFILSPSVVTSFNIVDKICNIPSSICNALLTNLTAGFSTIESKSNIEGKASLKIVYFFTYKISCYIGVYLVGIAIIFSKVFIIRWVGISYMNLSYITNILLIGFVFGTIQIPSIYLMFSVSKQSFYATVNWFQGIATVLLVTLLIFPYGLLGVAIAISSVMMFVKIFMQPLGVTSFFNMTLLQYHIYYTLPNMLFPVLYLLFLFALTNNLLAPKYFTIIVIILVSTFCYFILIYFLGFNKKEKKYIRALPSALFKFGDR